MGDQALAELLGNWGEFLGSIGVLATLIYLSIQVGQAKKATRAQIVQSATEQVNQVNLLIASDPSWAAIMKKESESLDEMLPEERSRHAFMELAICRALESLYFHHLDGYVDPRVWEAQENALTALAASPGWQQWWREQPFGFSREFSKLVEQKLKLR